MRRTYQSKKDTTVVLDHKDVLLNMDEKSSAFDAFYIQNIKQTKREMSCLGASNHYGGPTKKVRNRKYVKRIVKVEPVIRESLSNSVYMTPEKSIRVNKAADLFDQLLNSSLQKESPCSSKTDVFKELQCNRDRKTYTHKKTIKNKKLNYSSSESDSEKENSIFKATNITKNTSNINIQKLLIEKQDQPTSKAIDQSICNILEKLPQLNKMVNQRKSNYSRISFKPHRHRLTKNLNASVLDHSPLCSTPFKEKYRGNSIYNFSPISNNKLENSLNYVTLTNKSVSPQSDIWNKPDSKKSPVLDYIQSPILQSNKTIKCNKLESSLNYVTLTNQSVSPQSDIWDKPDNKKSPVLDCIQSPILQSNITIKCNDTQKNASKSYSNISKNQKRMENLSVISKESYEDILEHVSIDTSPAKLQPETTESRLILGFTDPSCGESSKTNEQVINNDNLHTLSAEIQVLDESHDVNKDDNHSSVLHTTEAEPFIGFHNPSPARTSKLEKICIEDSFNSSDDSVQQLTIQDQKDISHVEKYKTECNVTTEAMLNETENNKSHENICMDEVYDCGNFENSQIKDIVNETKVDKSYNDLGSKDEVIDKTKDHSQETSTNGDNTDPNSESSFDVSDNDFDTCNSEQSDSDDDISGTIKYPKVEIVKLRQSILEKYYKKLDNNHNSSLSDEDSQDKSSPDELNVSAKEQLNSGNLNESLGSSSADELTNLATRNIQDNIIISSSEGDCVDSNSNDEDRCISFVTTRRRYEAYNNTSIFVLDNTICSPTSSDGDKTVISIKTEKNDEEKTDLNETNNNLNNKLLQEWNAVQMERKTMCKKKTDTRSSVSSQNSSRMTKQSLSHDITLKSDIKDAIVLNPGKKWERSLSIFKRMTQIADHFDESIINEDPHKGRNYRQSVINVMENQEDGSVHNVSISSRRCSILSKPSRSTVRLINDTSSSRLSTTALFDDLKGFLHEDCDDTVIELSKLSIADSDREITIVENLDECERGIHDSRGTTARDYVLRRCNQRDVIHFDECYPETDLKNCHKIGEGVYGEVYLWRARDGRARVMKIIPIAGDIKVNGESQKDYQEIIAEIVIAMELSALRTPLSDIERCLDEGRDVDSLDLLSIENATDVFNEVVGVRCVYGSYPARLLDLWELYDEVKGSENDNPAILPPDQQYIVLELANAGQDLESYQFNSAEQAHALFWQVAFGLAVGEEAYQLEHRDLHWGNVLISATEEKLVTFVLRGRVYRVRSCGVRAAIIDYSLSRVSLALGGGAAAALYNDLALDHDLFTAVGDYQFDVYRLMRDKLGNEWKNFEPSTNILWLHYTVDKMITALRYKRTNTKIHKHYIAKLKGIKNRILQYGSATEFVLTDNDY